ncbi:SNF2-related protein [Streptomyces sp. 7N604]|uniref:SNF2-related protein n=1 Tax=Streptomyces sp. 7N604 TaxID=3457415 RepID=UPI003FD4AD43
MADSGREAVDVVPAGRRAGDGSQREWLKRRAQDEERQLLQAGGTDSFSALDARGFRRLLVRACADRLFTPALCAEAARRAAGGRLTTRDVRLILLEAVGDAAAENARHAVWDAIVRRPQDATAVLTSHDQASGGGALLMRTERREVGHEGQACWRSSGRLVHGVVVRADQSKTVLHLAALSLLGHLSGVQPVPQVPVVDAGWEPVTGTPGMPAQRVGAGETASSAFHEQLRQMCAHPVTAPAVVTEVAARARAGTLQPRDVYVVLFEARAEQWAPARQAAIEAAALRGVAPSVLALHAAAAKQPQPQYMYRTVGEFSPPRFTCTSSYDPGDGLLAVDCEVRRTKNQARDGAALGMLERITGLEAPELEPVVGEPPVLGLQPGKNPVSALHELAQIEVITDLDFHVTSTVSGKQPLFTCVASCTKAGSAWTATGQGVGKNSAREEAAGALLQQLAADGSPPSTAPAPAAGQTVSVIPKLKPGKNPASAVHELVQIEVITDLDFAYEETGKPSFTCTASCRHAGQVVQGTGRGRSKKMAREASCRDLLTRLTLIAAPPERQTATEPDGAAADGAHGRPEPAHALAAWPVLSGPEAAETTRAVVRLLGEGAALTADIEHGTRMLLYRPDGEPLPEPCHTALSGTVELILPGMGVAVRRMPVEVWQVPWRVLVNALAALNHAGQRVHPTATVWWQVLRLGLEAIAGEQVYPGVDQDGHDVWRLGPLTSGQRDRARQLARSMPAHAHCLPLPATKPPYRLWAPQVVLRRVFDALADALVRSPGAAAVHGPGPYTSPAPRPQGTQLRDWGESVEQLADPHAPSLVLSIKPPPANSPADTELLWAVLRIKTSGTDGQARVLDASVALPESGADPHLLGQVRRRLRTGARAWPPLQRLLESDRPGRCTIRAVEAALLLGEMGAELARLGIEISWPNRWPQALGVRTVVGSRSTPSTPDRGSAPHRFALDNVLDFRWQLTVDGENLTDTEMDAIAGSGHALVQVRQRWLLITEQTAQRAAHRQLDPLPAADALTAALSGSISIDGVLHSCEPADALADLVEFLRAGTHQPVAIPAALRAELRDYQVRGLAWLANTTRMGFGALYADDMGTGKSLAALALHLHRRETTPRTAPTLIICPASMLTGWEREIGRFAPTTSVRRYHGTDRTLDDITSDTVLITTYGTLLRDGDILAAQSFDLVIADEAQHVKNHLSATARTLRRLVCSARVALTGTPLENRLEDLWALMDWLNPGLFGTLRAFNERYGVPVEHDPAHSPATARLARLLGPFMLRRRKSDAHILKELPDKVTNHRYVRLSGEQVTLYEAVAREAMEQIRASDSIQRRGLVLTLLRQLRQICNTPAHYLRETPSLEGYDPDAAAARSGKLAALDELIAQIQETSESALVFTNFAAMGRLLVTHLKARGITEPLFFHGRIPPGRARQQLVDAFQTRHSPLMVLTIKAAGTGLSLTEAAHVVLFDRPWNPAVETQAVDRAHRIGQTKSLQVHYLTSEFSIEDRIDALLEHKRALADAVLSGGETALTELTDGELADLITLGGRA